MYCGGLACVAAHSFEEAVQQCQAEDELQGDTTFMEVQEVEGEGNGAFVWVLAQRIQITEDTPVGMVEFSWNYA